MATSSRPSDRAPEGRHRLAVAHAQDEHPASSVVDCDELAAWLPETAERVERADEIVGEIAGSAPSWSRRTSSPR